MVVAMVAVGLIVGAGIVLSRLSPDEVAPVPVVEEALHDAGPAAEAARESWKDHWAQIPLDPTGRSLGPKAA